jgi:phage terminase large subunit-like protein
LLHLQQEEVIRVVPREANRNAEKRTKTDQIAPWFAWEIQDRAERAILFIETYCVLPKGFGSGKPVRLAAFQKDWIRSIIRPGVNSAVMSIGRGNGKSTLLAALALWALFDTDPESGSPQIPIIALALRQAEKAVYEVAVQMIEAAPEMKDRCIRYNANGAMRTVVPYNHGTLFPVSSDVAALQGLDPSFAIADEIGFQSIESWDSLLLASGKRPRSLVIGIGTPGPDFDSALFHLRKAVREGAEIPGFVYTEYAADEACRIDDEDQWRKANPALDEGYMAISALRTALRLSPESQFRIYRLGQWVSGSDCWLGTDGRNVWDRLKDPYGFVPGAPTWLGVDMGLYKDSTAVASVQIRPDGRLHIKTKIWMPQKDTPVDLVEVMEYLRNQCDTYKVGAISYDPRLFEYAAMMLHQEGLPMVNVPQTPARMTPIIGNTYERILNGEISHDDDEIFATHVLNAVPKIQENGFTLQKSKSRGKIDACIAMTLAVDRAIFRPPPRPKIVVL